MTSPSCPEPVLQDFLTVLRAPGAVVSDPSGDVVRHTAQGFFLRDRRYLSHLVVRVDGEQPVPVGHVVSADRGMFELVAAQVDYVPMEGPSLHLLRSRELLTDGFADVITVESQSVNPISVRVTLDVEADLAPMNAVRSGLPTDAIRPAVHHDGLRWADHSCQVSLGWSVGAAARVGTSNAAEIRWEVDLAPGDRWTVRVEASVDDRRRGGSLTLESGSADGLFTVPEPDARPLPYRRLLDTSLADLRALLLCDAAEPEQVFVAAGSPWYFTLFGRDAIWTSRLLAPVAPELGRGTLMALASRQGRAVDPASEEEPGRIPHEVRREAVEVLGALHLPPTYYGNVDATALWISLLHEVWLAGRLGADTDRMLPRLRLALDWLASWGDVDGDGFVEYRGRSRQGLANQGWKDSPTGVRFADGVVPEGPIALCEVQAYAYQAARAGAAMLAAAGDPEADRWVSWAERLKERFRAAFWLEDDVGPYPAIALDGRKTRVTGAASNIGHLLGTGIVDGDEAAHIVRRLRAPDLDSGYGIRTLSSRVPAYSSLSYHRGSVWPHDTAITIRGLLAEGHGESARHFAEGLVAASGAFNGRLPELYGGNARDGERPLSTYPTACAPQAWAAAAGVVAVGVLEGWLT